MNWNFHDMKAADQLIFTTLEKENNTSLVGNVIPVRSTLMSWLKYSYYLSI